MERVGIVARLKQGSEPRAAQLIAEGPPFDLAEIGLLAHDVYLSPGEVVFIFEGHDVEWIVDELIDSPFQHELQTVLGLWRAIVEGAPHIAREQFEWRVDGTQHARETVAGSG